MQQLLPRHFNIPHYLARKYACPGTNYYDELVAAGNYALVRAHLNFKEDKGAKLTSWLYGCVALVMRREVYPHIHRHEGRWRRMASLDAPLYKNDRGRASSLLDLVGTASEEEDVDVKDLIERLMLRLEPLDRTLLRLRAFDNLTLKQIAKKVGVRKSRVAVLYHKALENARTILEDWLSEGE